MSLSPPHNPKIGQVWVDSFTAERFVYTGISTDPNEAFDGWEKWDLANERYEYGQGEASSPASSPRECPCPNCPSPTDCEGAQSPASKPQSVCLCNDFKGNMHFDRSLCACGAMHCYCDDCGWQVEACDPEPVPASRPHEHDWSLPTGSGVFVCMTCGVETSDLGAPLPATGNCSDCGRPMTTEEAIRSDACPECDPASDSLVVAPMDLGLPVDDAKIAEDIRIRNEVQRGYFRDDYPEASNQDKGQSE